LLAQEKVSDDRKAMLVKKVAAVAGVQATAPLLAWSAASIKQHLLTVLDHSSASTNVEEGSSAVVAYHEDLWGLAQAAGAS
jgi:hypothetical protein